MTEKSSVSFFVSRPILMAMIFLALTTGGFFALFNMKVDLLPTVNLPLVQVTVINPGMGSEDMEELVTKRLERVFSDLGGLDKLHSYSSEGVSQLVVEFEYGKRKIDEAAIEVQRRINEVRSELPATIEEPLVRKMDPATRPIMTIAFSASESGQAMNLRQLREYAENNLKRQFEQVPDVARVIVNGGAVRQVNIEVNPQKLEAFKLPIAQIHQTLKYNNMNIPGGDIKFDSWQITVRSMGQYSNLDQIRNTVIAQRNGQAIKLRDIASVSDSRMEARGFSSLNGSPSIIFAIKKSTGSNTVEISDGVQKAVKEMSANLPAGSQLLVVRDDAQFIKASINSITSAAWQGFLLAFLSVLLILGQFRTAMIIFISVPISIISTFLIIYLNGLNISMVVLYALILSMGVNFDASVVLLESIFRHMEQGKSRLMAASAAVRELWAPLFASTLTNVIVFMPLTQMKGYIGELMGAMALSAISAQVMALPVALFFTSSMTPLIVKDYQKEVSNFMGLGFIFRLTTGFVDRLAKIYAGFLESVLNHKKLTLLITAVTLIASFFLVPLIGVEFMPRVDQSEYFLELETPPDSTLSHTIEVVQKVEKVLEKQPELTYSIVNIGGDSASSPPVNKASFSLKFKSHTQRDRTVIDSGNPKTDIITNIRQQIQASVPSIQHMQFVQPAPWWGSAGAPIEVNLYGVDWDLLNETADQYVKALSPIQGLFDVQKNTREGRYELQVHFQEEKLSALGLSKGDVAQYLRTAVHGGDVSQARTEFRIGGIFRDKDIFVITRLASFGRDDIEKVKNLPLIGRNGKTVRLHQVATFSKKKGSGFITKENKLRKVTVLVQTSNEPLNELVFNRVLPALKTIEVPQGVKMTLTGEVTRMNDQVSGMGIGFAVAFIFIFMVLAGQFESFRHPILMLAAIPVMMIGVFLALFLTGTTLNTTSGNGIFALMGVVVNTSVILIDFINQLRKQGYSVREALISGCKTRLRPILMTVCTTFFAMIPMALSHGEGSEMYKPLAIAFLGGIVTSTILTLVLIPVLYELVEKDVNA